MRAVAPASAPCAVRVAARARAPAAAPQRAASAARGTRLQAAPRLRCRPAAAMRAVAAVEVASAPSGGASLEKLRFMSPAEAVAVRQQFGSPAYVYDAGTLKKQAQAALAFPNAFGLTVRYAMKSSPNAAILKLFDSLGLHIDASSGYEVQRAMSAGIAASKMSLSSQELPEFFPELIRFGVKLNACSLSQLEAYGAAFPGGEVGLRFNPGLGSGGTGKTNVGGPDSSFGIWHELLPQAQAIVAKHKLKVVRIHTHIGSGSDPAVWQRVSGLSIDLCRKFPDVTTLNLGGGYKVGRMAYEKGTELAVIGAPVRDAFVAFSTETGRKLHLEIEPGTFLLANSCSIVSTVQDTAATSSRAFLKLDCGMTEVLRPSLYGAQHPLVIVKRDGAVTGATKKYVIVGHCCESGDLLSPAPGEPETIDERELVAADIGDLCVIEGSGAYCSGMSTKNYNSFPEAAEVMRDTKGGLHLIRARQGLKQIYENERPLPANAAL